MLVAKGSICVVPEVKHLKSGLVSELKFDPLFTWGGARAMPLSVFLLHTKSHKSEKLEGVIKWFKQAC